MEKSRLEAFSDGVFAIVVTLLVLDIRLPEGTVAQNLDEHLVHVLPALGTYALSFTIVGMYWVAHHMAARMFKAIDARILWLNILMLLFVGLIPFTTGLLSRYAHDSWAVALYGINIMLINIAGWFIIHYLYHHQNLANFKFSKEIFAAHRQQYLKIGLLYAVGIIFSFINPIVSIYVYGLITLYLIAGMLFPQLSWRRRFTI